MLTDFGCGIKQKHRHARNNHDYFKYLFEILFHLLFQCFQNPPMKHDCLKSIIDQRLFCVSSRKKFCWRNDTHTHGSMLSSSTSVPKVSSVVYLRSRTFSFFQMTTIQSNCSFLPAIHNFSFRICMIFFFSLLFKHLLIISLEERTRERERRKKSLRVCVYTRT